MKCLEWPVYSSHIHHTLSSLFLLCSESLCLSGYVFLPSWLMSVQLHSLLTLLKSHIGLLASRSHVSTHSVRTRSVLAEEPGACSSRHRVWRKSFISNLPSDGSRQTREQILPYHLNISLLPMVWPDHHQGFTGSHWQTLSLLYLLLTRKLCFLHMGLTGLHSTDMNSENHNLHQSKLSVVGLNLLSLHEAFDTTGSTTENTWLLSLWPPVVFITIKAYFFNLNIFFICKLYYILFSSWVLKFL